MSTHARAREGTRPRGGLPPNRRLHRARRMTHEQVEKQTRDIRGEPPAAALKRPPTYSLVLAPTCHQVPFVTLTQRPGMYVHTTPRTHMHTASHAHAHTTYACACETQSALSNIEGQHTASCALPRLSTPEDRKSSRRKSWWEKSAPAPQARAFSSGSPPCPARERAMRLRRARRKRLRTPDECLSVASSRRAHSLLLMHLQSQERRKLEACVPLTSRRRPAMPVASPSSLHVI